MPMHVCTRWQPILACLWFRKTRDDACRHCESLGIRHGIHGRFAGQLLIDSKPCRIEVNRGVFETCLFCRIFYLNFEIGGHSRFRLFGAHPTHHHLDCLTAGPDYFSLKRQAPHHHCTRQRETFQINLASPARCSSLDLYRSSPHE